MRPTRMLNSQMVVVVVAGGDELKVAREREDGAS
jgi:hypothetical protein